MTLLQQPKKLRVFVLFSGSASAVRYLVDHDKNCDLTYEIIGAFTDNEDATAIEFFNELAPKDFQCEIFSLQTFCKWKNATLKDGRMREEYFAVVHQCIAKYEPDLIICSGFMLIVPDSFLRQFPKKIINVHPADLTIEQDGRPRFTGRHAVKVAIDSGQEALRSTVHYIEEGKGIDCGEIICVSSHAVHVKKWYSAKWHQGAMKQLCDGPAMRLALQNLTAHVPTAT